jgi:hypothetical protein
MSRRGSILPPNCVIDGVPVDTTRWDVLHHFLVCLGYDLQEPVRTFKHSNGDVTFRFVWRHRERGVSASIVRSVRTSIGGSRVQ